AATRKPPTTCRRHWTRQHTATPNEPIENAVATTSGNSPNSTPQTRLPTRQQPAEGQSLSVQLPRSLLKMDFEAEDDGGAEGREGWEAAGAGVLAVTSWAESIPIGPVPSSSESSSAWSTSTLADARRPVRWMTR